MTYTVSSGTLNSSIPYHTIPILYLTDNPNGEAEVITIVLSDLSKARSKVFDFDFSTLDIKGRGAQGNLLTRHAVRKIRLKAAGQSTLGAIDIWYDRTVGKLNKAGRGTLLGAFQAQDGILVILQDGHYLLTSFDLTHQYDPEQTLLLEKWVPEQPISAVHYDGKTKQYFVKRFCIATTTLDKQFPFIAAAKGSQLVLATTAAQPQLSIT